MKLFCFACGHAHSFTTGEVERIVYALQGAEADARCALNSVQREKMAP